MDFDKKEEENFPLNPEQENQAAPASSNLSPPESAFGAHSVCEGESAALVDPHRGNLSAPLPPVGSLGRSGEVATSLSTPPTPPLTGATSETGQQFLFPEFSTRSTAEREIGEEPIGHAPRDATQAARPTDGWGTLVQEARSLARDVVFAVIAAIFIVWFVVQPVKVQGTSMLPELKDGERIFVNKFIYTFSTIERGDIVVFWYPKDPDKSFIKRVIGLPNDEIRVEGGRLYVNGRLYDEPYLDPERTRMPLSPMVVHVDQHHYFVMGDNRDQSNDSRTWGQVPEKYIYGKAMLRYWPIEDFGPIRSEGHK